MKTDRWLDALFAKVEEHRTRPLEWGVWDCCQFAAECVLVQTGVDHRAAFPLYASETEALEIVADHDGMGGLLSSLFGPPIPVARAMRGDLLELPLNICAVCLGVMCAATAPEGLRFTPTSEALAAYGVD